MAFASPQRAAAQLDTLPGPARRELRGPRAGRAGQSGTEPGQVTEGRAPPARPPPLPRKAADLTAGAEFAAQPASHLRAPHGGAPAARGGRAGG